MDGIIPLYKEKGMTSFACVSKLRGILKMKRIGHSGTLDPNVEGVLPICLGKGTKLVDYLMNSGKIYQGSITLGMSTTTEDLDGEIIETKELHKPLKDEEINQLLNSFVSEDLIQIPPMYSAVKVNGKRLYEYARNNEIVERPKRHVKINYFKQIKNSVYDEYKKQQTIYFEVGCGKGTYVRTLAVDFGRKIGMPAVMSSLTRIKSGGFDISETFKLSDVQNAAEHDSLEEVILPIDTALNNFMHIELNTEQWKIVKNGGFLNANVLQSFEHKCVLTYQQKVKAIYYLDELTGLYKPEKMLNNN
jgi:tRNA pseudouridine55 synthase